MVAFATVNAQEVMQVKSITTNNDSLYAKLNAQLNMVGDAQKNKLLIETYQTLNDFWDLQRKQTTEMIFGLGIGSFGIATFVKAVNMPIPVRQVNNPALNEKADKAQRDRRIVGATSIGVSAIGAIIFSRSFRHTKRFKADIGFQTLKLEFALTGNRSYFQGRKNKKLKKLGIYPKKNWR